jgi:hypothetical protein
LSAQLVDWVYKANTLSRIVATVVPALALVSATAHFGFNIDLVNDMSRLTLCPFKFLADITCPGCGMMRAIIRLGQLQFTEAWSYHPFSYPVLLGATLYAGAGKLPHKALHAPLAALALGLLVLLWLSRAPIMG